MAFQAKPLFVMWVYSSIALSLTSCAPDSSSLENFNQSYANRSDVQIQNILYGVPVTDKGLKMSIVGINECTGSYIGDNFIISAAHCEKQFIEGSISFNLPSRVVTCPIVNWIMHDEYNPENSFNDIALIKFECSPEDQKAIAQVKPFLLDNGTIHNKGVYSLAGYGINEDNMGTNFPDLRYYKSTHLTTLDKLFDIIEAHSIPKGVALGWSTEQAANWAKKSRITRQKKYAELEDKNLSLIFKVKDNQSIHLGDSGGPVYFYDKTSQSYYLSGVISFMLLDGRLSDIKSSIIHGSFATKIETYLDWINTSKKKLQENRF